MNEWADYKRERDWRADPWYDDGGADAAATITVKTVRDAYNLLTRVFDPLKVRAVGACKGCGVCGV